MAEKLPDEVSRNSESVPVYGKNFPSSVPAVDSPAILAPDSLGFLVAKHVAKIRSFDSTAVLSKGNFYHTHILYDKLYKDTCSFNDFPKRISGLLYHSHESNWKGDVPRSIIGWCDGSIEVPVVTDSLAKKLPHYESNGTLHEEDIRKLYSVNYSVLKIEVGDSFITPKFITFRPEKNGRYIVNNDDTIEVFLEF